MISQNWSRNPIIAVMEMVDLVADLLYKHNCVIVPGLGGFISNYSQAEFKEEYLTLFPARKRIAFNEQLHENDGLLINHVSKTKRIPYSEAEIQVQQFVEYVSERIHSHKSFEFRNVGTFYYTRENKVVFVPYEGLNMFTGSYGLPPLKIRSVRKNALPAETEVLPVIPSEKKVRKLKQNRPASFNIRKLWPVISGAAVILFIAVSIQFLSQADFTTLGMRKKDVQKQQDASLLKFDTQEKVATVPDPMVETPKPETEVKENTPESITKNIPAETIASTEIKEKKSDSPDWLVEWQKNRKPTQYYIVIEQSADRTPLEKKLAKLLESGYAAEIIHQEEMHLLSIEHFSAETNATEYLRLIKRSFNKATILPIAL